MTVFFVSVFDKNIQDDLLWEGSVEVTSIARLEHTLRDRLRDAKIEFTSPSDMEIYYTQMHKLGGD